MANLLSFECVRRTIFFLNSDSVVRLLFEIVSALLYDRTHSICSTLQFFSEDSKGRKKRMRFDLLFYQGRILFVFFWGGGHVANKYYHTGRKADAAGSEYA